MKDRRSKLRPKSLSPKKRLKWWIKNNSLYLIIMVGVCLIVALVLIFAVHRHERMRNMEALLQKSRRDMHWGGITDNDVEVLKKRYPNINWDSQFDRNRWQTGKQYIREKRAKERAAKSLVEQK